MYKVGICGTSAFFRNGMKRLVEGKDSVDFDTLEQACSSARIYRKLVVLAHESDLLTSGGSHRSAEDRVDVIAIASRFDPAALATLISMGVKGYQLETVSSAVMKATIDLVGLGEFALPSVVAQHLSGTRAHETVVPLSAREVTVMRYLAQGLANKEISRSIGIAEATTKVHVKAIMRKLGATNRTQAAVWAVTHGFDYPAALR